MVSPHSYITLFTCVCRIHFKLIQLMYNVKVFLFMGGYRPFTILFCVILLSLKLTSRTSPPPLQLLILLLLWMMIMIGHLKLYSLNYWTLKTNTVHVHYEKFTIAIKLCSILRQIYITAHCCPFNCPFCTLSTSRPKRK